MLEQSVQRIDGTHEKTAALGKAKAAMGDAGRFPLKPEVPRPEDYPVKKNIKEHSEIFLDKWGFFMIVFHIRGTLFFRLVRQFVLLALDVVLVWQLKQRRIIVTHLSCDADDAPSAGAGGTPDDCDRNFEHTLAAFSTAHALMAGTLSLLLAFRTNSAYERFYEGKKLLGDVTNQIRQICLCAEGFNTFHEVLCRLSYYYQYYY